MKQALLNLVRNGLEASKQGGQIIISGKIENRFYVIGIADSGSGIPEDIRSQIFDIYYTTKKEGTGMGLPIVYKIVQSHHGTIEMESQEGKGTTFHIRLPLEEQV